MLKFIKPIPGILVVLLGLGSIQSLAKPQKGTSIPTNLRTELPEILGQLDELSIRKIPARDDSVVFKPLEYRYEPTQLKQDTLADKGMPAPASESRPAMFEYHLGCGSFGQFDVDFATWQRFATSELKLRAYFHQNDSQFDNNRLRTGIFSGHLSNQINPGFRINSNLEYTFRNYQLQSAPQPQTERKGKNFQFSGNVPIQASANSFTVFQAKFEHFGLSEPSPTGQAPFENRENTLSLAGKYFYRFGHSVAILEINFFHNSVAFVPDSTVSDFISNVKTQFVHQFNSNFSVAAGVTLSNISISETAAETRLLPYGKIIFAQKNRWGFFLTASQQLEYQTFNSLWQMNPYLELPNRLDLRERNYALGATLEIVLRPTLEIKLAAEQNKLVNTGYFQATNYLFRYYRVPETVQTTIKPGFKWQILPALKAEWEATISHFKFDSTITVTGARHLPFQENFSTEFNLSYEVAAFGRLCLGAQFIGKRYPDFEKHFPIDSVVLVNLKYEKNYNEYVTLYAQIHNLLNQDYHFWKGYREPGIYFLAGVEGKW